MKTTGIVRKVDELGRIVIPKETRKQLNISLKDPLEIFIDEEESILILKRYSRGCVFCGQLEELQVYRDKLICQNCLSSINDRGV